jgi:hypothetical protein
MARVIKACREKVSFSLQAFCINEKDVDKKIIAEYNLSMK